MKISINWLSEFVNIPKNLKDLTDKLTMAGHMLDKIEKFDKDTIVDLELRGNRADCYSVFGIAREVAAIYGLKLREPKLIELSSKKSPEIPTLNIKTDLVRRAGMSVVKNVKIIESPRWLKDKLASAGIESKNNIVDLTNYVMIELGEPMHAFDLEKVKDGLQIRPAKDGEKLTTFQNKDIVLTRDDLVWSVGANAVSVAGAVGEKHHSVTDKTKDILVEAANYERSNIRRTVYRHNLLTEAGIRHEKELDPNLVNIAIARFLYLIKQNDWGEVDAHFSDYYPKKAKPWKLKLNTNYQNSLIGASINITETKNILTRLGFKTQASGQNLFVEVPTFRTDVVSEEDLVEEVARIWGYDKIPVNTLALPIPKKITPDFIVQESELRINATSVGFDEMITMSFVKEANKKETSVALINPPSPDLKYLRDSLLPNLKEAGQKIINERGTLVQLFEIGKVYNKKGTGYKEERKMGFIFGKNTKSNFSEFKSLIEAFFAKNGFKPPQYNPEPVNLDLEYSYTVKIENDTVGYGGSSGNYHYLEIDLESVLGKAQKYNVTLWASYPPQIEDITITVPEHTLLGSVINEIYTVSKLVKNIEYKDKYGSSYTFTVYYQDPQKTLTNTEIEKARREIIEKIKLKFGATVKD